MPRLKFIQDSNAAYHICGRSRNRDWYELPMLTVWEILCDHAFFLHYAYGFRILNFVLMANHFHMICQAPLGNLSAGMQWFMGSSSRHMQREAGRINQIWGTRFFRSRLDSYHYIMNCYKYVYQNPIRAGICRRVEEYPYSTLSGMVGNSKLLIPLALESMLHENGLENTLEWLNTRSSEEAVKGMRSGLRRQEFSFPRQKRKISPFEISLI